MNDFLAPSMNSPTDGAGSPGGLPSSAVGSIGAFAERCLS